jgi:hypothetical protein
LKDLFSWTQRDSIEVKTRSRLLKLLLVFPNSRLDPLFIIDVRVLVTSLATLCAHPIIIPLCVILCFLDVKTEPPFSGFSILYDRMVVEVSFRFRFCHTKKYMLLYPSYNMSSHQ